jgi:hypothetical protein
MIDALHERLMADARKVAALATSPVNSLPEFYFDLGELAQRMAGYSMEAYDLAHPTDLCEVLPELPLVRTIPIAIGSPT